MVEHFRTHVKHKIGGRAKAMVVTDGRLHAVRYKQAFDTYIAEKGYTDVKTLVAFSGIVEDPDAPGKSFTEVGMNGGIKESELPERFDSHEYQVLLVAEKYQTGFDQPLLHTMYVDKKAHRPAGRADALAAEPHLRGQGRHVHPRFPQHAARKSSRPSSPTTKTRPSEPLTDAQHLYRLQHQIEETHSFTRRR